MNLKKMPTGHVWVDPTQIVAVCQTEAYQGNRFVPAIELCFRSGDKKTYFLRDTTVEAWIEALREPPVPGRL